MSDRSLMPVRAISKVLGIGFAVSVSTSTPVASAFTASLCETPKRCSSSTTSSPRSLNLTPADEEPVSSDDDVDRTVRQAGEDLFRLRRGEKAREHRDAHGHRSIPVGERLRVLLSEKGGGHQHGDLLTVLYGLECRSDGNLGLAESDVATDETVHGGRRLHVALHLGDRIQLIGRLHVPEGVLHLALPGSVRAERMTGDQQSRLVELHELARYLLDRGTSLGPRALPVRAAELVERRGVAARVRSEDFDLLCRYVELVVAPVLEKQVVTRSAVDGARDHPPVAGHSVLAVHDVVAGGEIVEEPVGRARLGPPDAVARRRPVMSCSVRTATFAVGRRNPRSMPATTTRIPLPVSFASAQGSGLRARGPKRPEALLRQHRRKAGHRALVVRAQHHGPALSDEGTEPARPCGPIG